jgi:hypothetical protein
MEIADRSKAKMSEAIKFQNSASAFCFYFLFCLASIAIIFTIITISTIILPVIIVYIVIELLFYIFT